MDGGLSWTGLNELLPNLPVKRILATPSGTSGTRVDIDGIGAMELPPGGSVWQAVDDRMAATDAMRLKAYSDRAGVALSAYGRSDKTVYAGTADGRILISRDEGASFTANGYGPRQRSGGTHFRRSGETGRGARCAGRSECSPRAAHHQRRPVLGCVGFQPAERAGPCRRRRTRGGRGLRRHRSGRFLGPYGSGQRVALPT